MNSLLKSAQTKVFRVYYWVINWLKIGGFVLSVGPFRALRALKSYPWIRTLLQVNELHLRLAQGRTGIYARASALVLSEIVSGVVQFLKETVRHDGKLILHEDMIPPEILRAMGLKPFMAELLGILLPIIEPHAMEQYIDRCQAEGIPPDLCSLPKSTMGLVLADHVPGVQAILASNLPCDGGMASYALIEKVLDKPTFRIDVPYDFRSDRAVSFFSSELYRMISWLEQTTSATMNWDKLAEICEQRNRMVELELDIWDMARQKPAPMAGEPIWMSHLWAFNVQPGAPESVRLFEKIRGLTRKNFKHKHGALEHERYRTLLWNPPTIHCADIFNWAERTYGLALLIDSMSYNRIPYIDTSSKDTMIDGLSRVIMEGPMARHTRGPAENYMSDIFTLYESFQLDMIWIDGHIGCKNTMALNTMLKEECRKREIPLLIIEYDLSDPRVVSRKRIEDQITFFMETIMEAEQVPEIR